MGFYVTFYLYLKTCPTTFVRKHDLSGLLRVNQARDNRINIVDFVCVMLNEYFKTVVL